MEYGKAYRWSLAANGLLLAALLGTLLYYDAPRSALRTLRSAFHQAPPESALSRSESALLRKLGRREPAVIVAFGDSVTEGWMDVSTRDGFAVYHHQLKVLLHERFPEPVLNVINSGRAGETVTDGLKRLEPDVFRYAPDLVLVQFGLNDCAAGGAAGVDSFRRTVQTAVERIREATGAEVILLTPNFMCTADNPNICAEHRDKGWAETFCRLQNEGTVARYAQAVRDVGSELSVPVADIYGQWQRLADEGGDTDALLANGLNHPNAEGHRLAAQTIFEVLMRDVEPNP